MVDRPVSTAAQLMTSGYPSIVLGSQLADAARLMAWSHLDMLPVTGSGGVLVGVVTERNVLSAVAVDAATPERMVDGLMTTDPAVIADYATVEWIMVEMEAARLSSLPVIDEHDCLIGVVSLTNLVEQVAPAILQRTWSRILSPRHD